MLPWNAQELNVRKIEGAFLWLRVVWDEFDLINYGMIAACNIYSQESLPFHQKRQSLVRLITIKILIVLKESFILEQQLKSRIITR